MSGGIITLSEQDGGSLVSSDEAPIGFIAPDGTIMAPSGAAYTVQDEPGRLAMVTADAQALVTLAGTILRDAKTGVEWRVRDAWLAAYRDGALTLDEIWALPYTLEDAQGTVPNRVKLLLAWIASRTGAGAGKPR